MVAAVSPISTRADAWVVGVNWYMNRNVKLQVHNSFVSVDKGTALLSTNASQDLNILGVRLPFAN